MSNMFSLEGKIALVTGASYGIGFAIACAMSDAGATVFCVNEFARRLSKDFVIFYTYLQFLKLRIAISQKSDYNNSVKRETFSRRLPPVYFRQINRTQTAEYRGLRRNGGLL